MKLGHKVTNSYFYLRNALPYIVFLLLIVTSCGKPPAAPLPPTISNPVSRPLIAVDLEIDTPPLYRLGHTVALAVTQKIDDLATRVNSAGLVIFACRISSMSWQDCPVSFKTPAVAAWVLPPSPPHCGNDPYQCSSLKKQYQKALAAWVIVHDSQIRSVGNVGISVQKLTDKMRTMPFPYDDKGSDIFGALATCAANLQGINTPYKFCLLATDFVSTTSEQGSFSLAGIRVVCVYRTSTSNAFNQESTAYWSHIVMSAGALSFTSYSVPQSQALGLELPA